MRGPSIEGEAHAASSACLLELGSTVRVDLLLGKVVGAGSGCDGDAVSRRADATRERVVLPTHKEPQPSLHRRTLGQ